MSQVKLHKVVEIEVHIIMMVEDVCVMVEGVCVMVEGVCVMVEGVCVMGRVFV